MRRMLVTAMSEAVRRLFARPAEVLFVPVELASTVGCSTCPPSIPPAANWRVLRLSRGSTDILDTALPKQARRWQFRASFPTRPPSATGGNGTGPGLPPPSSSSTRRVSSWRQTARRTARFRQASDAGAQFNGSPLVGRANELVDFLSAPAS
jgi:hypothetical protein